MEAFRSPEPREIKETAPYVYQIPLGYKPGMRVPGVIFADRELLRLAQEDKAFEQVANVAFLPGIVGASLAMPDIHWGYGFPIGGVAATRLDDGVVSPGGVGFDISCGVRLLRTNLEAKEARGKLPEIMHELSRSIPKGMGRHGRIKLSPAEIDRVLEKGARWCVQNGYGRQEDLAVIEQNGTYDWADPELVSRRAKERGFDQLGTIGSGNHFVEVQVVEEVYQQKAAAAFGLAPGQVAVMIHSGSRGLGHQVCTDYLKEMGPAAKIHRIELPDRQLACAPINSTIGRNYLAAMAAAANFGLANRQAIAHWARRTFEYFWRADERSLGMDLIYDVSHNVAQFERHEYGGRQVDLCVHRKGATRAFGPGRPEVPEPYAEIGQPVIIPGDMGTASYVLVGTETADSLSWGSTCHGAGRMMSRKQALKQTTGAALKKELESEGIVIEAGNIKSLAEEAPYAYKDVSRVVGVCEAVGLSKKVAKLKPLGVLKG